MQIAEVNEEIVNKMLAMDNQKDDACQKYKPKNTCIQYMQYWRELSIGFLGLMVILQWIVIGVQNASLRHTIDEQFQSFVKNDFNTTVRQFKSGIEKNQVKLTTQMNALSTSIKGFNESVMKLDKNDASLTSQINRLKIPANKLFAHKGRLIDFKKQHVIESVDHVTLSSNGSFIELSQEKSKKFYKWKWETSRKQIEEDNHEIQIDFNVKVNPWIETDGDDPSVELITDIGYLHMKTNGENEYSKAIILPSLFHSKRLRFKPNFNGIIWNLEICIKYKGEWIFRLVVE